MRIHLAERDPQHHGWPSRGAREHEMKLRILLSYHYYKDTDLDALFEKYFSRPYPEVFADSGAYSAFSLGEVIDLAQYAAWIKRWQHLFVTYANLDVIGDADGTRANQIALERAGLRPLPVFHTREPWEYLDWYLERYTYIALGGMVPYMKLPKRIMPWLVQCFKRAHGRAVYHGFGATAWTVVSNLPWYSVDSSSWGQGFRYGQVPIFDLKRGRFIKLQLGDGPAWQRNANLVRSLGFDWRDFGDRGRNDRAKICAISALSYMQAEKWLRARHGEIYIPDQPGAPSVPKAHLAAGGDVTDLGNKTFLVTAADGDGISNSKGGNMSIAALAQSGIADRGIKLHLADARPNSGGDLAAADVGLKLHLAEHSLDRGGVGDTSRAMEILKNE